MGEIRRFKEEKEGRGVKMGIEGTLGFGTDLTATAAASTIPLGVAGRALRAKRARAKKHKRHKHMARA